MHWIPLIAWLAALVIGAVVIGFCAYEIAWKARRLSADLRELQDVAEGLVQLQGAAAAAQQRFARAGTPDRP